MKAGNLEHAAQQTGSGQGGRVSFPRSSDGVNLFRQQSGSLPPLDIPVSPQSTWLIYPWGREDPSKFVQFQGLPEDFELFASCA